MRRPKTAQPKGPAQTFFKNRQCLCAACSASEDSQNCLLTEGVLGRVPFKPVFLAHGFQAALISSSPRTSACVFRGPRVFCGLAASQPIFQPSGFDKKKMREKYWAVRPGSTMPPLGRVDCTAASLKPQLSRRLKKICTLHSACTRQPKGLKWWLPEELMSKVPNKSPWHSKPSNTSTQS